MNENKTKKTIKQQISFPNDLYEWLAKRYVENPFETNINTYSDAVLHCVKIVKNIMTRKEKKIEFTKEMQLNGKTLKYIRVFIKSITQVELSKSINISQSYISKIEKNGFLDLSLNFNNSLLIDKELKSALMKIFEFYGIDKDEFIKIRNENKNDIISLFI